MTKFKDLHPTKIIKKPPLQRIYTERDNLFSDIKLEHNVHKNLQGKGIKIAVIDSGVNVNHSEIKGKIIKTTNMFNNSTTEIPDVYGHGTHVIGLIVGENIGIASKAEIYAASVINDKGYGSSRSIYEGINFAINNKVDILCMSLGSSNPLNNSINKLLKKAYNNGITIVSANGNNGMQKKEYPAALDFVIGVSGVNDSLKLSDFSNYGFHTDISAPSSNIFSSYGNDEYSYMSGTSMATPIVVGGIALLQEYHHNRYNKRMNPKEVHKLISSLRNKKDRYLGYGILDIKKLL